MRKCIAVVLGLFIFFPDFGQSAIKFSMGIKPNFSYDQTITQKTNIEINLDSSTAEVLAAMDSGGMKNPSIQESEYLMEVMLQSGSQDAKTGKIPVTMSFLKSGEKMANILTPGMKFFGWASPDGLPVYDSISGVTLDEKQKQQILKMSAVVSQITLPGKRLKVGESDTLNNPMVIPLGGMNMAMDYVTIYHLQSIQGHTAMFDVHAQFKLNMEVKDIPVEGSGAGEGSMEYDLQNRYPSLFRLRYQIYLRIAKEGMIMHLKMNDDYENACKIQAVK
jgi:hypothetical protein